MLKLVLKVEDARDAVWGDHPDFDIIENTIYDTDRWSEWHECILKHNGTGDIWGVHYYEGSTEMQDEQPFKGEKEATFIKMVAVQRTVTKYEAIKEDSE